MDVYHAIDQYKAHQGVTSFENYIHPPISVQSRPFVMKIPEYYLPWDEKNGVIAMRRKEKALASCRCGLILAGIYIQVGNATKQQIPLALKAMDRQQVLVQNDDIESEVRIMAQLQAAGFDAPLSNAHTLRWECGEDQHNHYIATEFIANGSLVSYAHKKIHSLMVNHLNEFIKKQGAGPTKLECISYVYRGAGHEWMREGLSIFMGIMKGLTYLHAQSVAHMDLDIYNVAIDKEFIPRIIDLGSAQLMDHRGFAGSGNVGIKCKPAFVAPEVRSHFRIPPPRPGFDGAKADLWAAGVIVSNY